MSIYYKMDERKPFSPRNSHDSRNYSRQNSNATPSNGPFMERQDENRRKNGNYRYTRRSNNKNWPVYSRANKSRYNAANNRQSNSVFKNQPPQQERYDNDIRQGGTWKTNQKPKIVLQCLPECILALIFSKLDPKSLISVGATSRRFKQIITEEKIRAAIKSRGSKILDELPTEILVHIFGFVERADLGRLAQVTKQTYCMGMALI